MRGAALLQLQNLLLGVRVKYGNLKAALCEGFVPKERRELHKAEFRARCREREERLPDLASSLRRLVGKAYLEVVTDLQDSLAKDQFIDALEDREIQMKIRESTPKTLDEAIVEPCRSRQCTRLGLSARSIGVIDTRAIKRGEERTCRAPEAKNGCHKPDGSVCAEITTTPNLERE